VCLHITSLPGPYGIGEIGQSARDFIDAMGKMRLGVWQFLPVGPTAYGDSPYQPLSTFAGNEMLIDVRDLIQKGFEMLGTNLPWNGELFVHMDNEESGEAVAYLSREDYILPNFTE